MSANKALAVKGGIIKKPNNEKNQKNKSVCFSNQLDTVHNLPANNRGPNTFSVEEEMQTRQEAGLENKKKFDFSDPKILGKVFSARIQETKQYTFVIKYYQTDKLRSSGTYVNGNDRPFTNVPPEILDEYNHFLLQNYIRCNYDTLKQQLQGLSYRSFGKKKKKTKHGVKRIPQSLKNKCKKLRIPFRNYEKRIGKMWSISNLRKIVKQKLKLLKNKKGKPKMSPSKALQKGIKKLKGKNGKLYCIKLIKKSKRSKKLPQWVICKK